MNTVHLIGSEEVSRAGNNISGAAEQMQRAASSFECSAERLTRSLDDHAMRLGDLLTQEPAKAALRRVIVSMRIYIAPGHHDVQEVGPALFHQWGCEFEEFEGGPGNCTVAIVEFPDGSIKTVLPQDIKFEVAP